MAKITDYFATATGNWSEITWYQDAAGTLPHINGGDDTALPMYGDTVWICDGIVLTIDIPYTPQLAMIRNLVYEEGVTAATGRCIVNAGVTVSFDAMDAGYCGSNGFFRFEGGAGTSCTLDGHVRGGIVSSAYGCRNVNAGTVNITTCTGGSTSGVYGCYNVAAGIVNITTCTGGNGSLAYGCRNNTNGTVNITTCIGGSASGAHGCYNLADGIVNITTCIGGSASSAYGCSLYNNTSPTGRCYITGSVKAGFDGANPVSGLLNRDTNAGYHFLAYGAKLYDRFGNEETSNFTAINSIASVGYGWLITAEIDSAADLAAIDNLTGDANVSFVQTGDFEVTTPPNIGSVTAFLGSYTGYDAMAQRQHDITFTYGNGTQEEIVNLFGDNGLGALIERCNLIVNLNVHEVEGDAITLALNNEGTIRNCVVSGSIAGGIAAGLVGDNAATGVIQNSYCLVEGVDLLMSNTGGTVTNCYHLSDTTEGVTQLTTTQMQGKGMDLDYINIWQEDIGGRNNNWLPYLRDGRYIKRRREPVGAL